MYCKDLKLNTYEASFCGEQVWDTEAGGGKRIAHIPICFGGELPAHSQNKGGPLWRGYEG